jgi:hypothetical protein
MKYKTTEESMCRLLKIDFPSFDTYLTPMALSRLIYLLVSRTVSVQLLKFLH